MDLEYIGGFQAPNPKKRIHYGNDVIEGGAKKKQTKFKRKVGTPVHTVGKETDKMIKQMGAKVGDSLAKIRTDLNKERVKFRANTNKAGTQIKKMERRAGATKKGAMQEANRFKDALKADLKRLTAQATLKALKEFNNKLK